MAFDYDFLEYLGTDFSLSTSSYKTIPRTLWTPTKNCLLIPKIYVNISYALPKSATKDGRVRFYMMRTSPENETFYFDVELPRGRTSKLDTKLELKRWGADDLGRKVYFAAKAYDVSSCTLQESTYVAYAQIT